MASGDVLSNTLSTITSIKLAEITQQRVRFEESKKALLLAVQNEPNQGEKIRLLLNCVDELPSMTKFDSNPAISFPYIRRFVNQADLDPSVPTHLLKAWQEQLEAELEVHSQKYNYAALYGQLVNEWLAASAKVPSATESLSESAFEEVGRKEMYEQREIYEKYVFEAKETDQKAIYAYLEGLFTSNQATTTAFASLKRRVVEFEKSLAAKKHFDEASLTSVANSLLKSDLLDAQKRATLKDFLNNKVVLAELADVLNMRMSSLDKWSWDPAGIPIEQRRQLNGKYRVYQDEDLLQTLLLRYIGVQWNVFFRSLLIDFREAPDTWPVTAKPMTKLDRKRRLYFLGNESCNESVDDFREVYYSDSIFLEQLQDKVDENRGYDDDSCDGGDARKKPLEIMQSLLHTVATEVVMKTRLGEEITVVRSDFKWFGPSLPHSTIFAVLDFFGVSEKWINLFRHILECPLRFIHDGPDSPVRRRKRGVPPTGPLYDVLGEAVLFCLDFAMAQQGTRLYRLHDDIWFWGSDETCIQGWAIMSKFAEVTGLEFNKEKTGSVKITRKGNTAPAVAVGLPTGDVRWGFLKLDAVTGKFLIDREVVDTHIVELRRQLDACKSVFDWIQAWNIYGVRFFTNNFGTPARCFGLDHVDMMLKTFQHIQAKLFPNGSATTHLRETIIERFKVQDVYEGYLQFPISLGGLDLKNPFMTLYYEGNSMDKDVDKSMDTFFEREQRKYQVLKKQFEDGLVAVPSGALGPKDDFGDEFMSFEEYTRYRELTSDPLARAYTTMLHVPSRARPVATPEVANRQSQISWDTLDAYDCWTVQLYAPEMIKRFGGLRIVEKGLLPTGMVNMLRENRFKWQS
ncbi:hypothetical protein BP6252_07362 [Coleophoma cylindrospora]|uniref:Reverse transcriptase domain-containing protein n=1 Tax=Coleophoma cylindrospora TaxID=1849047 RepID=A0A3D8RHC3_9HELO|nr:hypothetical protein BP6252_07362 [Coleophoma cylindrospora]